MIYRWYGFIDRPSERLEAILKMRRNVLETQTRLLSQWVSSSFSLTILSDLLVSTVSIDSAFKSLETPLKLQLVNSSHQQSNIKRRNPANDDLVLLVSFLSFRTRMKVLGSNRNEDQTLLRNSSLLRDHSVLRLSSSQINQCCKEREGSLTLSSEMLKLSVSPILKLSHWRFD